MVIIIFVIIWWYLLFVSLMILIITTTTSPDFLPHDVAPRSWLRRLRGHYCDCPWHRYLPCLRRWPPEDNRTVPHGEPEYAACSGHDFSHDDIHLDSDLAGIPNGNVRLRRSVQSGNARWRCWDCVRLLRVPSCVLPTQTDQCQRGKSGTTGKLFSFD